MQVNQVVSAVVSNSGMSYNAVSAKLCKSREYARNIAVRASAPRLDTVADIADVCGYDLQLVRRDTGATVTVTPPRRASMDRDAGGESNDLDGGGNGGGE